MIFKIENQFGTNRSNLYTKYDKILLYPAAKTIMLLKQELAYPATMVRLAEADI